MEHFAEIAKTPVGHPVDTDLALQVQLVEEIANRIRPASATSTWACTCRASDVDVVGIVLNALPCLLGPLVNECASLLVPSSFFWRCVLQMDENT